jgi:hypothetical protein
MGPGLISLGRELEESLKVFSLKTAIPERRDGAWRLQRFEVKRDHMAPRTTGKLSYVSYPLWMDNLFVCPSETR